MDNLEKRSFIAIGLSVLILVGWFYFVSKRSQNSPTSPLPEQESTPQEEAHRGKAPVSDGSTQPNIPAATGKARATSQEISFQTETYEALLSTRGGALKGWKLKTYKDQIGPAGKEIQMLSEEDPGRYSLALFFSDDELQKFQDVEYEIEKQTADEILFSYRGYGLRIERHYRFQKENPFAFYHHTKIWPQKIKAQGDVLIGISEGLSSELKGQPLTASYQDSRQFVYHLLQSKTKRQKIKDLEKNYTVPLVSQWVGVENRYFLSALVNRTKLKPYVSLSSHFPGKGLVAFQYPFYTEKEKDFFEIELTGYLGPKKINILKQTEPSLTEAIDFGIFSFLCIPLLKAMNFFYRYTYNYGIAIILLTLLIRVLFHPLTKKSLVSMKQMQKIQPQMAQLREKYKSDKYKLNQEIMDLMRKNKVNPLGGCLPLLFQMPIFFALYRLLYNAIELYQAPFFGWIQDLSAKDPYYIMPLFMGVAMFAQQKLTPMTTMDPMQQKMMLLMPIVFTFFMIPLPSGLVVYIFFSTVLQVLSQLWVNRDLVKQGL